MEVTRSSGFYIALRILQIQEDWGEEGLAGFSMLLVPEVQTLAKEPSPHLLGFADEGWAWLVQLADLAPSFTCSRNSV